jgi:hypothetical protein
MDNGKIQSQANAFQEKLELAYANNERNKREYERVYEEWLECEKNAVESEKNVMDDMVNHPPHYTKGKIEVIDFIEDQKLGYHEANIIKYVCRYKYKNGIQDLLKARWYLERLIIGDDPDLTVSTLKYEGAW